MSDTPMTPAEKFAARVAADKALAAMDASAPEVDQGAQLQELIELLFIDSHVAVSTHFGDEYQVPSHIPARRQQRAARVFRKILESDNGKKLATAFEEAQAVKTTDVVATALQLISDDDGLINDLGRLFHTVHPGIAKKMVKDAQGKTDDEDEKVTDVLDVLGIEEIVAALAPFCFRIARRALGGLVKVNKVMPTR